MCSKTRAYLLRNHVKKIHNRAKIAKLADVAAESLNGPVALWPSPKYNEDLDFLFSLDYAPLRNQAPVRQRDLLLRMQGREVELCQMMCP